jgi:hypothetical protein
MKNFSGLFAKISDETDMRKFVKVSPDSTQQLLDIGVIFFCSSCGCFHQESDVEWSDLIEEIKALAN